MKKCLIAIAILIVTSLVGNTQEYIQGSVQKNANPNQVEVVFKPNFNKRTSPLQEYILFLQFSVSVPLGAGSPVSATAVGTGTFSNMGSLGIIPSHDETFGTPSTADDERAYGFVFASPTASTQTWSAGVAFTGAIVTFSGPVTTEIRLLDLENNAGGDNGNTYYILSSNYGTVRPDDPFFPPGEGPLFFAITGSSTIGFFPHTTQTGFPDRFARTGAATTACNAGTVSGTSPLCVGATATYSSNGDAGGTWSSTNPAVASVDAATGLVTALSAGTTNITYTVSAGCSPTASAFKTLTVNPSPTVSCPPNSSVCINVVPFALTGGLPAGGTYSGTGVSAGQFDPAAAGVGTHTITYTVTASGCSASCTFTITVNALPTVGCPSNSSVCISTATFALTGGTPSGGTYSGTGVSGGNFNPAAAGTGTHTITYSFTDGNGCTSSCTFTITVNPLPSVGCPSNSSVCIDAAAFALTGGTPTGGTYSGTGVSGGNFNPAAAGVGVHTITYTFTNANGCTSSCTFTITVNPLPTVSCPSNSTVCISVPAFALTGGLPAGGTYSGTGVSGGNFNPQAAGAGTHTITYTYTDGNGCSSSCTFTITVNGLPVVTCPANSSTNLNTPPFTLTGGLPLGGIYSGPGVSGGQFDPAAAGQGTHTITYTFTNTATGCTGSCTFTITVGPAVTITCPPNTAVCINAAPFTLTGASPAGGTFSGPGVSGGMFNPATAGVGAHTITYTTSQGSCTFTITVNPLPSVSCPANSSVCINALAFALTGGTPTGGIYSGTGVVGGNFNPAVAGVGTHVITYTFTSTITGCSASCTFTITVNPLPTLTCPANSNVCISAGAFALTGGIPAGGTYSGTGVAGGFFSPAAAGVGAHAITYTYTDGNGCSNSCTFTITVNPLPTVSCPANSSVCINSSAFALTGGTPTGGTYSGTGVSGGNFNPAAAGVGAHTITYTFTNASTGCTASCTFTITVNPLPSVSCPANSSVCINAAPFALLGGTPTGGTYSGTGVAGGMFNPAAAGIGVHTITYTFTNATTGCSASCTFTITVTTSVTITAIAGPNGSITPGGTTTVSCGGSQTYTIVANSCYSIADVLVNGVSVGAVSSYTFTNVNTSQTISATFVINGPYTIVASSGPNGSVTPPGTTTVTCGDRVTYTITPDNCYSIADVLIDGVSDPGAIMSGTYTFNNVSANHTIHATFAPAGPFNIVATSGINGTVTPAGTTVVACGGGQMYSIIPDAGFVISTVLINGVNNPAAVSSGTYTFSNVQMNQTIHATFVTACSPTTVTITASQSSFCANLTLTANPATPGAYTYEWKRGALVVGTSQTLVLTTASPDGVYTVTAASGPSCISAPASYTYSKQGNVQTYTILGLDKVELGETNIVLRGSVGNTKVGGEIAIKKNSVIASPGAFVKASKIKVDNPSNVPIRIFAPVMVTLPAMQYNTTSTSGLSNISIPKTALPSTYTGNYKDVTVKKGAVTTLTGSIFGKIKLEEGAKVTFTSSVVNIQELEMQNGTSSKLTEIKFAVDCNVRSKKKVKVEEYCRINTSASKNVVFYVDTENFEVKSKNTNIVASIYAPTKDIKIDGDGPCNMTGRFIAKTIHGHAKNVTWNNFDCAAPPVAPRIAPSTTATELITKMEMQAYPNPTSNYFNLKLKTDAEGDVMVRIISISGKVMQELKGSANQIFRVGDGLLPGFYIAEMKQGEEKVTVKLVKKQ